MLLRIILFVSFAILLIGCEEVEIPVIDKLQGRWEAIDGQHIATEFDKSVFRIEKAVEYGTDHCGGIRWNTTKEVFTYSLVSGGIKTCETGSLYQTMYECDSTVVNYWQTRDCNGNRIYHLNFESENQITIQCDSEDLNVTLRKQQ